MKLKMNKIQLLNSLKHSQILLKELQTHVELFEKGDPEDVLKAKIVDSLCSISVIILEEANKLNPGTPTVMVGLGQKIKTKAVYTKKTQKVIDDSKSKPKAKPKKVVK
jgi:hypothetical protein